jgi:hypothetical protein
MPAFASDAPPSNAFLQSEPAQRQFLLKSSRAIARGVLLGRTQVRLRPLLYQVSGYRQICFRPAEASPAAIPLRAVPAPVVQKRKLLKVHHIRTTYDGLQLRRRLSV